MQGKRHDRVVEMRLCFFSGKVGDYKVPFKSTRKCRSTLDKGYSLVRPLAAGVRFMTTVATCNSRSHAALAQLQKQTRDSSNSPCA